MRVAIDLTALLPEQTGVADSAALAESMARLLDDASVRAMRSAAGLARARQFRWDEAARAMHACYRELCARRAAARERAREITRTEESGLGS